MTLPLVGRTDQKMNGIGFFRSEYAAGNTGSAPHLTPEAEVKPHIAPGANEVFYYLKMDTIE
ncbi:hypothetical protein ABIA48_004853 [Pseudomonas sp. S30_BP2TU TE3576]|uniref:hypothetical protein n=1 Tax=Pseudomonas sp. S30_BP2TU TE3576 TaxID=3349329 RepID=UPI003D235FF6